MADSLAQSVCSVVSHLEDIRLPHTRFRSFVTAACVGIPLVVLLHDASHLWGSLSTKIPIISWFQRRWKDRTLVLTDLQTARNMLLFSLVVILFMNSDNAAPDMPADYLERRLTNTNAVQSVNNQLYSARSAAFNAAGSVLQEEEMNASGTQQQRDAALRRRFLRQSHAS